MYAAHNTGFEPVDDSKDPEDHATNEHAPAGSAYAGSSAPAAADAADNPSATGTAEQSSGRLSRLSREAWRLYPGSDRSLCAGVEEAVSTADAAPAAEPEPREIRRSSRHAKPTERALASRGENGGLRGGLRGGGSVGDGSGVGGSVGGGRVGGRGADEDEGEDADDEGGDDEGGDGEEGAEGEDGGDGAPSVPAAKTNGSAECGDAVGTSSLRPRRQHVSYKEVNERRIYQEAPSSSGGAQNPNTRYVGEVLEVEVEEDGKRFWVTAEVIRLLRSGRFEARVNNDDDFIER